MIKLFNIGLIAVMLMVSTTSYSDSSALQACDKALTDCQAVVAAQDSQIKHLQEDQEKLAKALAEAKQRESSMPEWLIILTAGLAGIVVGTQLR